MYKLLIAEDEAIIRRGMERAMNWRAKGFELAASVEDGAEALEVLRSRHIDVLLTDIKMPGVDGLTLLREIKREQPGLQVIVVTGYADFAYAREALKHSAFDYVLKMDLLTELPQVLDRLREQLDASDFEARGAHPIYRAFMRSDTSGIAINQPHALPALISGDGAMIEALLRPLPDERRSRLKDGLFGALLCAPTREALSRAAEALCEAAADAGALAVLSARAVDARSLAPSCRLAMKALDYAALHAELAPPRSGRPGLDAAEIKWPGGEVDLKAHAGAIAQAVSALDEAQAGSRVDDMLRAVVEAPDRTVIDARLCLLDAFFRAASALPRELGQPYGEFLSDIGCLGSILDLAGPARRFATTAAAALKRLDADDSAIGRALRYMADNLSGNLRMEDVAQRVYMSPAYFSRRFKQCVGTGFSDHLKDLRLAWAKRLLEESDMRVIDVAREAGYADIKHFTRLFREAYGVLPSAARERAKSN